MKLFGMLKSYIEIPPSATLRMNTLALAKKQRGERVYNLSAGEPFLPTDSGVIEAACRAMRAGQTHYPPVLGLPELRRAAAEWMNSTYATAYAPDEVIATCGGKFGLYALCRALLGPGDEALIIAPYWVSYPSLIQLAGASAVTVATAPERGWKASRQDLEQAITPRTRVIIFNNAANPTGVVYHREEIGALLECAAAHDLAVVSDEVYSGLVYDGRIFVSAGSFPEHHGRVFVVQSVSKHFAMTGWRVGFVLGDKGIIESLGVLQSQSTTGTASISQWAATAALAMAPAIMSEVSQKMSERRDALHSALQSTFGGFRAKPASGLYTLAALADLGVKDTASTAFCERLLEQANIALVPGAPFGQEGYVRFSFGEDSAELCAAVRALGEYLKKTRLLV